MNSRRKFLTDVVKTSAFLPFYNRFGDQLFSNDTIIEDIQILKVSGPFTREHSGFNRQHQSHANDIYEELRPDVYVDRPNSPPGTYTLNHIYLKIITRGGIEGLYGEIEHSLVEPILKQLKPFLIGKDALAGEKLWDQMYRGNRHARAGHYMMAISAVDNCLWDIRGKYFKAPVYELLGGPTRSKAQVYGSCLGFSIEKGIVGPRAKQLFDQGFTHQKWFTAYGPGDGTQGMIRNIELVEELRTSLGEDARIMFDAYMAWDVTYAIRWCNAVEKYHPYWLEEAFTPEHLESFRLLSEKTTVPIATGEHFYSRWEVQNFLKADAIKIIQADPEWCGGVSELTKICTLATAFGAKVIPHGHSIHAALHVVLSQSPEVCPLVEYLINHVPYKMHFQKEKFVTQNGFLPLPTKAGFGIEFDDSTVEKIEVLV
ncbi:enolase C-terminal domain-like protein [Jiulongibacter sediminis]|jgi:L-alanine-DL-glutamate epimerase-like enolase superfamily enzyme|uniref:enolase C-terminal domain-like protein n=1 Tax=Jiulongibacter sediminis TaxID=1605367 RepID=UPI0026F12AB7|nr:enolase C-terminal domain-like protein [Jiulongibacter sediminis]